MKILIVEDDQLIADALRRRLKMRYTVDTVESGRAALSQAGFITYDLILLDLGLPDMDGREVCRLLRRQGVTAPILILTGSPAVSDKIALLDGGADDYLTKPFSADEVQARIRALLRRAAIQAAAPASSRLSVAGLQLDPAARLAWRRDNQLELRRKDFDILEYLVRHHGRTVTRAMLVNHVWPADEHLWANVVDVHIKHLRDEVDRPYSSNLIQTVHGIGYRLEGESPHGAATLG